MRADSLHGFLENAAAGDRSPRKRTRRGPSARLSARTGSQTTGQQLRHARRASQPDRLHIWPPAEHRGGSARARPVVAGAPVRPQRAVEAQHGERRVGRAAAAAFASAARCAGSSSGPSTHDAPPRSAYRPPGAGAGCRPVLPARRRRRGSGLRRRCASAPRPVRCTAGRRPRHQRAAPGRRRAVVGVPRARAGNVVGVARGQIDAARAVAEQRLSASVASASPRSRSSGSPRRLEQRERGARHGGVIVEHARRADAAGAPGVEEPPVAVAQRRRRRRRRRRGRRRAIRARRRRRAARASAAIVRPFQSARTLSSRAGLARLSRERKQLRARTAASSRLARRRRRGGVTRLSTVRPSQLPPARTS